MAEGSGANMAEIDKIKETSRLLDELEEHRETTPLIYRANPPLRDLKPEHFEAGVISLGLFNRSSWIDFNGRTKEKDSLKIDVLATFLADIGERPEDWMKISEEVVREPMAMTKLYERSPCLNLKLSSEIIRSALALDSIFIASLSLYLFKHKIDTIYLERTFKCLRREHFRKDTFAELCFDSLKMENQVPLMLIGNVIDIIVRSLGEDVPNHAEKRDDVLQIICFQWTLTYGNGFPSCQFDNSLLKFSKYQHLYHCIAEAFWNGANSDTSDNLSGANTKEPRYIVPTVEELHKRGITFEGQKDFFPKFRQNKLARWKATLCLPKLTDIGDDTEMFWRNLLAFESDFAASKSPLTQYLCFMDELINTERDVSILSRGKNGVILGNGLGDNQAVAALFNSITKNLSFVRDDRWTSLIHEINKFYHNPVGRNIAEFEEQYCSKPWLVCSVVAAVVLLILTLLQTYYAMWAYYHPS